MERKGERLKTGKIGGAAAVAAAATAAATAAAAASCSSGGPSSPISRSRPQMSTQLFFFLRSLFSQACKETELFHKTQMQKKGTDFFAVSTFVSL